ncbi:Ig-like domain-containing protein, partial [Gilvibacter sediminis]|nr:Ig-like domain-containing protein [Gilvibacter sediminis]
MPWKQAKAFFVLLVLALMAIAPSFAQIGTQSPSIRDGVTFQWSDEQDTDGNGDINSTENNNPATIESITIGSTVYNTFAVPSAYQLTRLGPAGHDRNNIKLNGTEPIGTSVTATFDITDSTPWDDAALATFQDQNLNHYFEASSGQGDDICGEFDEANGTGGEDETDAQLQTIFYDPPLPSNADGVLAVTERGGNNCYYVRMVGFPAGGGAEQVLGDTFVRTSGNLTGGGFSAPANDDTDYWGSGREQDNSQTIAIALFELNSIAPTGSKISRIEFVAASSDHGDGKFFILQTYAVDQTKLGCIDTTIDGDLNIDNNVPDGSTYTVLSGPSPAGLAFTLNTDGTYSYTPPAGFTGDVTFTYEVCLPAPNDDICGTASVTLTVNSLPDNPTVEVYCNTDGTYTLEVTAPLGADFEYVINDGAYQSSPVFSGLGEGTYVFGVRNNFTGCENRPSFTEVVIEDLAITTDVTDVDCFGEDTGAIDITVTGGFPPYTYLWSTGATTEDISGLTAGTYTVTVTDSAGCEVDSGSGYVVGGPDAELWVDADISDAECFGESNGAIDLTVTGGTAPYTFAWSTGATTEDISGLAAGDYSVDVTDANGCFFKDTYTVGQPDELTKSVKIDNVLCFGESTGAIELTVDGGTPPYSYAWSTGATTATVTGLAAGTYSVVITDANGCELDADFEIFQPDSAIAVSEVITDVACFGEASGAIDITVSGGTAPYTYAWTTGATTEDISGLAAGTYAVIVTDANGCDDEFTFVIDQPAGGLAVSAVAADAACFGEATGSVDLTVSGGTPPYTYLWTNGATTEDLPAVGSGSYNVTVTDANGCEASLSAAVTVDEPEPISIVITKENATTAQGCADGEATATPDGGTPPYTYLWSASAGSQTTATATNLPSGTHTVTVTDANGCELEQGVVIDCSNTCDAVIAVDDIVDVLCTGDDTGSATVSASSVANPGATFTFTWDTTPPTVESGVTSSTLSGLPAGIYTVSVTIDGTVCLPVEQSVTITEPASALNVSATATDESGPSTGDGTATAVVSGGTPPYSYSWSPGGETTEGISGLSAGTYTVTVTDANGCVESATVTVNPGTCLDLAVTATSTPVTCNGDSDGTVTAAVTGGSGSFTYLWSTGDTTAMVSGLPGGSYTVTVTDTVTLCEQTATTTVDEPNVLDSGIAVTNVLCHGEATGSLDLTVTGGTAPYTFAWSTGATTEDISGLTAGTYDVTITDANGCIATDSATISQPTRGLDISIDTQNDIVCTGLGDVTVAVLGGTAPYTYNIDGGAYGASATFSDLEAGSYVIGVLDANGCAATIDVNILFNCTDAIDDINNTFEGSAVSGNVLTNDEDFEGDNQTVTGNTDPANGTVVVNPDGSYTYTPNPGYTGEDSFEYTICDDGTPQACDTATVYIEVLPDSGPEN